MSVMSASCCWLRSGSLTPLSSLSLCHQTAPLAITYCPGKSFHIFFSPAHAAATSRLCLACLLMSWNCLHHAVCLRRCLFFCGAFTGPGFAWAAAAVFTAGALAPCGPLACTLMSCNKSEQSQPIEPIVPIPARDCALSNFTPTGTGTCAILGYLDPQVGHHLQS